MEYFYKNHSFLLFNILFYTVFSSCLNFVTIKRLFLFKMTHRLQVDVVNPLVSEVEECPICLNPLRNSVTLACGHAYHLKCIDAWFLRQKNCPYCRRKFVLPPPPPAAVEEVAASQQTTVCWCCFGKVLRRPSNVHRQSRATSA